MEIIFFTCVQFVHVCVGNHMQSVKLTNTLASQEPLEQGIPESSIFVSL
jgi:hypothetical protein